MAAMTAFLHVVSLAVLASAYPYNGDYRWTPEEVAAYLYARETLESQSPVEDLTFNTDNQGIGTASAVDVNSNDDLYLFQRADRLWTAESFDAHNVLSEAFQAPISDDTILQLDTLTGRVISSFGGGLFNMPHGLKFDNQDNFWLTDVGRHQVFRIPNGESKPDLVLGEKFVPGNDETHFCKPTDVAVASNGDFFVADGYCNHRVVKFNKDAQVVAQFGTKPTNGAVLSPTDLVIPHSVTLVEDLDLVCVADRENNRSVCFNAGVTSDRPVGSFNRTLIPQGDTGARVFAVYYDQADKEVVAASSVAMMPFLDQGMLVYPPRGYTYGLDGTQRDAWAPITESDSFSGPSMIHDLCVSKDGLDIYLADLLQQKVHKYTKRTTQA